MVDIRRCIHVIWIHRSPLDPPIQLQNKLTDEGKVALVLTLVIVQSSGILVVSNFMNEADGTGLLFSLFIRLVVLAVPK